MYRFGQSDKNSSACFCRRALFLAILLVLGSGSVCIGQKPQKLEKNYREWLERDVVYLINKEERDAFRRLATNEARDKFIEEFWESLSDRDLVLRRRQLRSPPVFLCHVLPAGRQRRLSLLQSLYRRTR